MSEIKGQLLGILLVIGIFGVVSAALMGVFNGLVDDVSSEVEGLQSSIKTPTNAVNTDSLLHY